MRYFVFVALLFLLGCGQNEERQKVDEIPMGYTGKARLNPYLAAEKYLNQQGWDVESSRTWSNYDDETQMIILPGSFLQTKGIAMRVLDWVNQGGNLVITIEGGEPDRNDFTESGSGMGVFEPGDYAGLDHALEQFKISSSQYSYQAAEDDSKNRGHLSRPWELVKTEEEWGGHSLEFEGEVGLNIEEGRNWIQNEDGKSRMVGLNYGAGEVLVLAHARPFRNPYLARADHAEFLDHLSGRYGDGGKIVFLYGSSNSFFGLVWKKGWMVVIAGLILLVVWLWMRIPRFGPILRDNLVKRQPYGESLITSARFLWRTGELEHLVRPLRAQLESEHQGDPASFYDRLAEESGLSRDEVVEAFTTDPPKDPGHILKVAQKLQILFKR
jgi:hypothetical protein